MTINKRFKGEQGKVSVVGEDLIFKLLSLFAEENQELRTKNNTYIQDVEAYREENTHLKLENEQLKSKNKELESELQIFKEDVTNLNQIINNLHKEKG